MKVTHIIFFHDELFACKNKKCKNKVFITPVDPEGVWRCPKCEKTQKIVDSVKVTIGKKERKEKKPKVKRI